MNIVEAHRHQPLQRLHLPVVGASGATARAHGRRRRRRRRRVRPRLRERLAFCGEISPYFRAQCRQAAAIRVRRRSPVPAAPGVWVHGRPRRLRHQARVRKGDERCVAARAQERRRLLPRELVESERAHEGCLHAERAMQPRAADAQRAAEREAGPCGSRRGAVDARVIAGHPKVGRGPVAVMIVVTPCRHVDDGGLLAIATGHRHADHIGGDLHAGPHVAPLEVVAATAVDVVAACVAPDDDAARGARACVLPAKGHEGRVRLPVKPLHV